MMKLVIPLNLLLITCQTGCKRLQNVTVHAAHAFEKMQELLKLNPTS